MQKPRYTEEILGIIFAWLGFMYICSGLLSFCGVVKPKPGSAIQDPVLSGTVFVLFGLVCMIVCAVFRKTAFRKKRIYDELKANGVRITGKAERVYRQRSVRYGKQSPYRIVYRYTYQDRAYIQKSRLLWEKPDIQAGDAVDVYVNDDGESALHV